MEQPASQNQNQTWWRKNQSYLVMAAILLALGILYYTTRDDSALKTPDTQHEQTQNDDGTANGNADENNNTENQNQGSEISGNVSATGELAISDDPAKGNLMIRTSNMNIYLQTKRDYSSLLGKQVNLSANGTISSFRLLGLREVLSDDGVGGPGDGAVEGEATEQVKITGTLQDSQRSDLGNYQIVSSGQPTVYLKSVHDYSALVGSPIELVANGTIQSFTGARVFKK